MCVGASSRGHSFETDFSFQPTHTSSLCYWPESQALLARWLLPHWSYSRILSTYQSVHSHSCFVAEACSAELSAGILPTI